MNPSTYTFFISNKLFSGNEDVFNTLLDLSDEHPDASEICFDLKGLKDLNPFNMLLIARKICKFRSAYPTKPFRFIRASVDDYLGHMGFYNAMGSDKYGKKMGEAKGSKTYIPIHEIRFDNIDFYGEIETIACRLSNVFQFDKDLANFLQYSFVETIRNVYEHSQSNKAFVCAQRWVTHNLVEIAVLDEGCGIATAMKPFAPLSSEEELLKLSLYPGISAKSNHSYLGKNNEWSNSGYGLYILKELCKTYKGSFTICSNNLAMRYYSSGEQALYKTSFHGTVVCLRFSTNLNIDFNKERSRIVREGQKISKEYKSAIHKASKSSGGNKQ